MAEQRGNPADAPGRRRWAWSAVGLGIWIVAGTFLVVRALNTGDAIDVGVSPYHAVVYLALLCLAILSIARVVLARRAGRGWREAFPPGYGSIGAGTAVLLLYVVADIAWREGVGIAEGGAEGGFAPSRVLLPIGLALVAMAALRAALLGVGPASRWPAAISAGAVLAAVASPGGFHPANSQWIERSDVPEPPSEIWVMDGDGNHQTRLLVGPKGAALGNPVWSPDGSQLAYTLSPLATNVADRDVDIWVADADGSDAHLLVGGPGWQWFPRWSPDGAWVAYTEEALGGPWIDSGPLGPAVGQGPQGPGFGATGSAARPEADLWRIATDGSGSKVRITDTPGDDRSGTWSPDGKRLAFDSTRDGNTEIYLVDADGANPVRLTDSPGEDWAAAWSPDGRHLAFSSDRSGDSQVWSMDADGGNPTQLTTDPAGSIWPAWSRDGMQLAITSWRTGVAQVWAISGDGTSPRELSRSQTTRDSVWDGSWATNRRILFMRTPAADVSTLPIVREDLGIAGTLISASLLALLVGLLGRVRPAFGGFAVLMGMSTALVAIPGGGWRYIPAAIVAGLAADMVARLAPDRYRSASTATAAAGLVVAAVATATLTTGVGWSATLWLGVAIAAGVVGWVIGTLVARTDDPHPGDDAATLAIGDAPG